MVFPGGITRYSAAAIFVYVGFLTDSSRNPWIFGYSASYVAFLLGLLLILASPLLVVRLVGKLGGRTVLFNTLPALALLLAIWLVASSIYYARQEHRFDPFLQAAPPTLDDLAAGDPAAELRIAVLGGSTTEDDWLAPEDRYPERLGSLFAAAQPQLQPRVFNSGKAWWTTKHTLTHYVTYVRRWNPDIVIVMHAMNDLYRSFSPPAFALGEYNDSWSHFYGPSINGARPPSFARFLFGDIFRLMYLHWYGDWRIREVDYPVDRYHSLPQFERNLRTLVDLVRNDGAEVVLLTQPSLYKDQVSDAERRVIRFGEEFCMTPTGLFSAEYPTWNIFHSMWR